MSKAQADANMAFANEGDDEECGSTCFKLLPILIWPHVKTF
jgi:hypothetical protein